MRNKSISNRMSLDFDYLKSRQSALICIHIKSFSNEPGFWRWEPRPVTYATKISLLVVASQQLHVESQQHVIKMETRNRAFAAYCLLNQRTQMAVSNRSNISMYTVDEKIINQLSHAVDTAGTVLCLV